MLTPTHYWNDKNFYCSIQSILSLCPTPLPHVFRSFFYFNNTLSPCPHFSCSNSLILSFLYWYLFIPSCSFHSSFPLSATLSLSLSIIHGAVTVRIKGPRNIATATTQQKQPHWIMGNWVTSQGREGIGGAVAGGCCHTHSRTHTHLIDVLQSRRTGRREVKDWRNGTVGRHNRAGQWRRYCPSQRKHMWACIVW